MNENSLTVGESDSSAPARLASAFARRDLTARLALLREAVDGRIVFTSSFGLEDQVITHAIFSTQVSRSRW